MNTSRKLLLAGAAVISTTAVASSAFAQASSSTSATASITIFRPISVSKTADLSFGRFIRPSTGSNVVTIDKDSGGRATTGGGNGAEAGGTTSRAEFGVSGEGGQVFDITSDATVNLGTGVVVNLVPSASTGTLDSTIGNSGTATFGVGGNVTLSSTSATGTLSGAFNVTVAYQ